MSPRSIAVLLVFLVFFAFSPSVLGNQDASGDYRWADGVGNGGTYSATYVAPDLGGAVLSVQDPEDLVVVTTIDDKFGAGLSGIVVCTGDLGPAATIDENTGGCSGPSCGPLVHGFATPDDTVTVFVFATYMISFSPCFGSNGTVDAVFG